MKRIFFVFLWAILGLFCLNSVSFAGNIKHHAKRNNGHRQLAITLIDPGDIDYNGNYLLVWSAEPGAAIYELQEAADTGFTNLTNAYWPTANEQRIFNFNAGQTFYYRVRGWTALPDSGGVPGDWSNTVDITLADPLTPAPNCPVLTTPPKDDNGNFLVQWTDEAGSGAKYYELKETIACFFPTGGPGCIKTNYYWLQDNELRTLSHWKAKFTYTVRAWTDLPENDGVMSDWSNSDSTLLFITQKIPAPVILDPGNIDNNGNFLVEWSDVAGAGIYELWMSTTPNFSTKTEFWPTQSEERMFVFDNGIYYFKVRSWTDSPGEDGTFSDWSSTVDMQVEITQFPPEAPVLNGPDTAVGSYNLNWTDESASGATIYELLTSIDPEFATYTSEWPTNNSITITPPGNAVYYHKVRAWTAVPEADGIMSAWSNVISVEVAGLAIPDIPILVDPGAVDHNGNYLLDWSDESASGAIMYELQEDDAADFNSPIAFYFPGYHQQRIFNFTNGTYYYRVRSWSGTPGGGGMPSGWSNVVDMAVDITQFPPDVPTLENPGPQSGSYTLTWTDESASGANIYEVLIDTNPGFTSPDVYWPSSNYLQVVPPTNGTYYHKVRAWTAIPEADGIMSAWSNEVAIEVNGMVIPETPILTDPGGVDYNGNYMVQWSNSQVLLYELQEDQDPEFNTPEYFWPSANYERRFNFVDGTYYYRVRAWSGQPGSGGVPSPWSNAVDMVVNITQFPPDTPTLSDPVIQPEYYVLNWTDESGSGATIYEAWASNDPEFSSYIVSWPHSPTATFYPTGPGVYFNKVRAWTTTPELDGVMSGWSNVVQVVY